MSKLLVIYFSANMFSIAFCGKITFINIHIMETNKMVKCVNIKETCYKASLDNVWTKNSNYFLAVKGNNGNDYIIKSRKYFCDDRLAQEYLAYELCVELGIQTPEFDLLKLDDQNFENSKDTFVNHGINKQIRKVNHDLYFGSKFIEPIENYNLEYDMNSDGLYNDLKKVENLEILAEIIAFTCFIVNADLFPNVYNILIKESKNDNKRYAYAIDFGNSFFSNDWSTEKKDYIYKVCKLSYEDKQKYAKEIEKQLFDTDKNNYCLSAMQKYIYFDQNNSFAEIVHKIESLSDVFLIEAVNNIPNAWLANPKEEKEAYTRFLIFKKSTVRFIVNEACKCDFHHFDNWNGQKLQWY